MNANPMTFELRGEFITLDALLKATGLADSGGSAKTLIASGRVLRADRGGSGPPE